jgi:hypothetical protein
LREENVASTWVHAGARAKVLRNLVPGTLSSERMLAQGFGGGNRGSFQFSMDLRLAKVA